MEGGRHAERGVAQRRQVGFLREVAGGEELNAGLLQAVLVIGFTKPSVVGPDGRKAKTASAPESLTRCMIGLKSVVDSGSRIEFDDLAAVRLEGRLRRPSRRRRPGRSR